MEVKKLHSLITTLLKMAAEQEQVGNGTPGHPHQFPYIDSWLLIAQTLPPWARFCMNGQGQGRVFVTQPLKKKKGTLYSREIQWKTHYCPRHAFL